MVVADWVEVWNGACWLVGCTNLLLEQIITFCFLLSPTIAGNSGICIQPCLDDVRLGRG